MGGGTSIEVGVRPTQAPRGNGTAFDFLSAAKFAIGRLELFWDTLFLEPRTIFNFGLNNLGHGMSENV